MLALDVAAIVLAGGKSTRLGRDKASEPLLGVPLLQRVLDSLAGLAAEVVIVRAKGQKLPELTPIGGLRVVEDLDPETGPLGGIYTGLDAIAAPSGLAVACDMPLLRPALLAELLRLVGRYDAVTPVSGGMRQPLCAVYSKACLGAIRRRLDAGDYRLTALLDDLKVLDVPESSWRAFDPDGISFLNLNREDDLARAEAILQAEAARLRA